MLRSALLMVAVLAAQSPGGRLVRERLLAELQPVALKNCVFEQVGSANVPHSPVGGPSINSLPRPW